MMRGDDGGRDDDATRVREYVRTEFVPSGDQAVFDDDYNLLERGVVDSLRLVQLIVWLESELGVELPDDMLSLASLATVSSIIALAERARADDRRLKGMPDEVTDQQGPDGSTAQ